MNPELAINFLTRRLISPRHAVELLNELDEATAVLKIYRHFFPKEFAASNYRLISSDGDVQSALIECFELVSTRLFEIPVYYFDELENEELPLSYIPIEPMFGEWWNDDIDTLFPLWQVLLVLIGAWEANDAENVLCKIAADAQQQWQAKMVDYRKLARLCRKASEPLRWLNLALLVLDHSTGNPWLDASYECPITDFEWTPRDVLHLQRKWLEAQRDCGRVAQLDDWLNEDTARIHQLLALWSKALVARPQGTSLSKR